MAEIYAADTTTAYHDTPVDYWISGTSLGQIEITVENEECNADIAVTDADAIVMLRLSRTEIAELIGSLAKAMAELS